MRALLLAMLMAGAGMATAQAPDRLVEIRAQQALLTQELDSGVLKLTPREVALIRKDQARVEAALAGKARLDDLNVAERTDLDNALERINARVVATRQAEEARDNCRYEVTTGSHMRKLSCATAGDRGDMRRNARAYMERPRICAGPGCGL